MGTSGLLRMHPAFEHFGLKDLLPLKLDVPDEGCTRPNSSMYCFEAGNKKNWYNYHTAELVLGNYLSQDRDAHNVFDR